jgi:DNA primase
MFYPDYVVEEIRSQNDIVSVIGGYVRLTRKGGNYFGLCPFHNESTPSFSVDSNKQFFYCFGCGATGNVISFIMRRENLDFPAAIKLLAERVNYALPSEGASIAGDTRKKILYDIHVEAARFFYDNLNEGALNYLDKRGVKESARKKFGVGYAPNEWNALTDRLAKDFSSEELLLSGLAIESKKNNKIYDRFRGRIMFPIINQAKKIIGFGGRTIVGDEAKYLNSPDTEIFDKGKNLYALNFAKSYVRNKTLIICEGYMDAIALHQAGFRNSAAVLGTALTKSHAYILRNLNADSVTLLFDSDAAGKAAVNRSIDILDDAGMKINIAAIEGAKDPDEFIKKYGAESFRAELEKTQDYITYKLNNIKENRDFSNPREKSDFIKEATAILAPLSEVDKAIYSEEIYKLTGIDKEIIQKNAASPLITSEKAPIHKKFVSKSVGAPNGSHKAQNFLIYIICVNPKAFRAVKDFISPEEFSGTHEKIARKVFEKLNENKQIGAAQLASYFFEREELALINEIFNNEIINIENAGEDLEKALTDCVKVVKRSALNRELEKEKNDDNAVNQIYLRRKYLQKLNIRLSDG